MDVNNYIAYEYLSLSVDSDMKMMYSDCYQNFGWQVVGIDSSKHTDSMTIKFKRNRRVKHRTRLNSLQRKCETALENVYHLERSKSTQAVVVSLSVGLIGTAFMALSVFAFLENHIILTVILAIPGILGWAMPHFIFTSVKKKRSTKINEQIDSEYEIVYQTCDEAHKLLEDQ